MMTDSFPSVSTERDWKPLRVWPATLIMASYWLAIAIGKPIGGPVTFLTILLASVLAAFAMLGWWLLASRATLRERLVLGLGMVAGCLAANLLADKMTAGVPFVIFVLPWILVGWWLVAAALGRSSPLIRMSGLLFTILGGCLLTDALRFQGVTGSMDSSATFRWQLRDEDRFLAANQQRPDFPRDAADLPLRPTPHDWTEFRGPRRDNRALGPTTLADWTDHPPKLRWKKLVGPGWSSFAVVGDYAFTQEQRSDLEVIVAYQLADGREAWSYPLPERFEEAAAGAGPRATPTLAGDRLYALSSQGSLVCLQASSGQLLWKKDLRTDTGASTPIWGFASSPLVSHGMVAVIACGPEAHAVAAYDAASGTLRWTAGRGNHSYASCQAADLGGVPQILAATNYGLQAFDINDGQLLWEHVWELPHAARMLQPLVIEEHGLLLHSHLEGARLLDIQRVQERWQVDTRWWSRRLKSYFNDCVLLDGYLYGFDNSIFTCVALATGEATWKKGRYGHGQVLLASRAKRLVVLGEFGELVLLAADPTQHRELGRIQALEGKTWNHPVLIDNLLLVRNASQMACYELAQAAAQQPATATSTETPPAANANRQLSLKTDGVFAKYRNTPGHEPTSKPRYNPHRSDLPLADPRRARDTERDKSLPTPAEAVEATSAGVSVTSQPKPAFSS
jgi:outer membrane protein assembly factor BamB